MAINEEDQAGIVKSAQTYKAPDTKPVTTDVYSKTDTVAGQLENLTADNSTYIRQAQTDAKQSANDRGLINSSIAAGAGTEAAIRSALPIAQQDATTYNTNRTNNQNTENDFLKNRQSANLNMETAAQGSGLNIGEANNQSANAITQQNNQSGLNQSEASQRSALNIVEANNQSGLNKSEASYNADLNTAKANLDSQLKMNEEKWSVDLRTQADIILNDNKFSDQVKLDYVTATNTIIRDTQQQITDIGLSDRTAPQQAEAIRMATVNRDAQLAVYQDLLGGFSDWDWGSDFTPGVQTGAGNTPLPGQESQISQQDAIAAEAARVAAAEPQQPQNIPVSTIPDGNGVDINGNQLTRPGQGIFYS